MQRKGILQFIKNCLMEEKYNSVISSSPKILDVMKSLLDSLHKHYGFLDISRNSKHQHRFELLYIQDEKMTFEEIAFETGLAGYEKLQRYVRKYNDLALKFIEFESTKIWEFRIILEEFKKINF